MLTCVAPNLLGSSTGALGSSSSLCAPHRKPLFKVLHLWVRSRAGLSAAQIGPAPQLPPYMI